MPISLSISQGTIVSHSADNHNDLATDLYKQHFRQTQKEGRQTVDVRTAGGSRICIDKHLLEWETTTRPGDL